MAELACLHPLAKAGSAPFRLHAERGVGFALVGDIDLSCDELFATTLRRVVPLLSGPELVVEVTYDHTSGGRIRHGSKIVRWRDDKAPKDCKIDQLV